MALKATIFKVDLQMTDMDRHYYQLHGLTMARHPSETDERLMMRLLAFARHADDALVFAKGLSDADEPDLWRKDPTSAIVSWIEVGQPDERRILKACGRAAQVIVYCYGATSGVWWSQTQRKIERARNLTVVRIDAVTSQALGALAKRTMQLQCTIDGGQIWLGNADSTVLIDVETLKEPAA